MQRFVTKSVTDTLLYSGGKDRRTFLTPYNEPMLILVRKIPGVEAMVVEDKFDFDNRISTSVSSHSH